MMKIHIVGLRMECSIRTVATGGSEPECREEYPVAPSEDNCAEMV